MGNLLTKADKRFFKNMIKDYRKDGLHKIFIVEVSRAINVAGGELNPITDDPTDPFGAPAGDEGFDETLTSSYVYGTVSYFDRSEAFRQFYRSGTFEEGTVTIMTDYDDSFDSKGRNKFLESDYIIIGSSMDKYKVRLSVPGDNNVGGFELGVKTIAKKITNVN